MEIKELNPKEVWKFFSEISEIPRCSGDEEAISNYLVDFAKERNLEVRQDEAKNVVIRKAASKGFEDKPIVALQAHMDMVCVKEDDSDHNFDTDPIGLLIGGDWVTADGTTLGADDGMGVAYILAILDDESLDHPGLEAIITTEEETSMLGAQALDTSDIKAKYLLNIDSEEEGYITIGCAGGLDLPISFAKEYEKANGDFIKVSLQGFEGGHSGMEIHKARLNAIKALSRLLLDIDGLQIAELAGGVKRNAIASNAYAIVSVADRTEAIDIINQRKDEILNESKDTDPKGTITVEEASFDGEVLTKDLSKRFIDCLFTLPNGLVKRHEGETITSSNIGILEEDDKEIRLSCMVRSQFDSAKHSIADQVMKIVENYGGSAEIKSEYPGWQREDTPLIKLSNDIWKDLHGDEMIIATTHGGLECGLLKGTLKDVEMISFGPEIHGAHSPAEKVHIKSVENNYKFLVELLKRI